VHFLIRNDDTCLKKSISRSDKRKEEEDGRRRKSHSYSTSQPTSTC